MSYCTNENTQQDKVSIIMDNIQNNIFMYNTKFSDEWGGGFGSEEKRRGGGGGREQVTGELIMSPLFAVWVNVIVPATVFEEVEKSS